MLPKAHKKRGVQSMMKFLKSLWRDRRGNALVIAGAALPLVVGSAGLASDTIQWTLWKRQLQRAADSAAIAGVYAKFNSQAVGTTVSTDLARNNHTFVALKTGYPQWSEPANTTAYTNAVKVDLAVQKTLGFSSLFLSIAPTITATATAAGVNSDPFCAVGLAATTEPSITMGGSSDVDLGCGAISNSISPTQSVSPNGSAYSFVADPVAGVGGMPTSITGATDIRPRHLPMQDPFAGKFSTDIPSGMNCQNFNQKAYTVTTGQGQSAVTTHKIAPGCFNGFNPGNNVYYLDPGVYYLNNTNFQANGNFTLIGTDVTFILTGTDPGSVTMNGNAVLQLKAPTTGPYAKMLFIQAANADLENNNTINGNSGSYFDGAFYFPKGEVTLTGSAGTETKCAMLVGYRLDFNGNVDLQNNTTGCVANQQVLGKRIRLIA